MNEPYLLDTSVVIDLVTGRLEGYEDPGRPRAVSAVTLAGLHHGLLVGGPEVQPRRLQAVQFVQRACTVLPVDDPVAEAYGRIATDARRLRGRRIALADGLIAATAAAHRIPLYTRDRDFADLPGVDVVLV